MTRKPTPHIAAIDTLAGQIRDLLETHWDQIERIRSEDQDEAVSVSVSTKIEGRIVKTSIAYAKKYKDEVESVLPDENQEEMEFRQ